MTQKTLGFYDHLTEENTIREMTSEEAISFAADHKRLTQKELDEAVAKKLAKDKLTALGLTAEDLIALGL
jgi:ribonuclease I